MIDAEAAKKNDVWDPNSSNAKSTALGLTQFTEGAWLEEAGKRGTYLNEKAKEMGLVDSKNHVKSGSESQLLDLRKDPTFSIVAAVERGARNLNEMERRGLVRSDATEAQLAGLMYKAHHEGLEGAVSFEGGTPKVRSAILTEERANRLLITNVGDERAKRLISNERDSSSINAYRKWLNNYTAKRVDPTRFR